MRTPEFRILSVLSLVILALAACAPLVSERVDEARNAVEAARAAGAPTRAPEEFQQAEQNLKQSEALLAAGNVVSLVRAGHRATLAEAAAISAAVTARQRADLEKTQGVAEAARQEASRAASSAAAAGEAAHAAQVQASQAENRAVRTEQEVYRLQQQAAAAQAPPPLTSFSHYVVKRRDTLPKIAARPDIYGNADEWTRIYEANRDFIGNDLKLQVGQVLLIPKP